MHAENLIVADALPRVDAYHIGWRCGSQFKAGRLFVGNVSDTGSITISGKPCCATDSTIFAKCKSNGPACDDVCEQQPLAALAEPTPEQVKPLPLPKKRNVGRKKPGGCGCGKGEAEAKPVEPENVLP